MSRIDEVFAEYGLGRDKEVNQDEIRNKVLWFIKMQGPRWIKTKSGIQKKMLDIHTREVGNIVIVNQKRFTEKLNEEKITLTIKPWQLEMMQLVQDIEEEKPTIEFKFRKHDARSILKERIKTNKEEMKMEFPELFLKHLFDGVVPIDKMKTEVRKKINVFTFGLNETEFKQKLEKELLQALWEEYEEILNAEEKNKSKQ